MMQTTDKSASIMSLPSRTSRAIEFDDSNLAQQAQEIANEGIAREVGPNTESNQELMAMVQDIALVGDYVVATRERVLGQPSADPINKSIGVFSLFRKFSLVEVNQRGLMSKEAEASKSLFVDEQSMFFYFDHIGEGRGEWVVHKPSTANPEEIITIRYEVSGADGHIIVKEPNKSKHRLANPAEIHRLHQATAAYYNLINNKLYN
ncbi:MAG: hypothetical protein WDZ42_00055 [Candidatus Saccharimonadales bacterium]